jgi:hypothetical protein
VLDDGVFSVNPGIKVSEQHPIILSRPSSPGQGRTKTSESGCIAVPGSKRLTCTAS